MVILQMKRRVIKTQHFLKKMVFQRCPFVSLNLLEFLFSFDIGQVV